MDPKQWIELGMLIIAGASALGAVTWRIMAYVAKVEKGLESRIEAVASSLDNKFILNMTEISKVKDNFVRRDDLAQYIARFDATQRDTVSALNSLRDRIDRFIEGRNGNG